MLQDDRRDLANLQTAPTRVYPYVCPFVCNGGTHQISKHSPNDARRANFSTTRKFRRRENFRKKNLGRCDHFRQQIIKIGAILVIFRPFKDFPRSRRSSRNIWSADLDELWIFERYHDVRLEKLPQMSKKSALYDFWWRGKKGDFDFFLDFWAKTDLHFF